MKRKILLFFVTAFIFVCLLALSVSAMSGSGTEADPYVVENAEDFVSIKNNLSAHYILPAQYEGALAAGPQISVSTGCSSANSSDIKLPSLRTITSASG